MIPDTYGKSTNSKIKTKPGDDAPGFYNRLSVAPYKKRMMDYFFSVVAADLFNAAVQSMLIALFSILR